MSKINTRRKPDASDSSPPSEEPEKCALCRGLGGVSRKVPVGHEDFGEIFLCQCQQEAEVEKKAERFLKYANLPHAQEPRTFENFETKPGLELAVQQARDYCLDQDGWTILTFVGPKGTGKTHLMAAVARHLLGQGAKVRYELVEDLLARFRGSFSKDSDEDFYDLWQSYLDVEVLLLDDLGGMDMATNWSTGIVSSLVDDRWRNGKRLVVGTNLTMREIAQHTDARVADRLWDRTNGIAQVAVLRGDSYRTGEQW